MQTFLDSVVKKLDAKDFEELVIILPSQRAGIFLQKKLIHALTGKTTILPQIKSIETFIEELSGLESMDQDEILLLFYEAYLSKCLENERKDFDSFISWGQTLLQDFNEIDRYLVDHNSFFKYLYYINDQKHWFLQENKTQLIENYIHFWESLQTYYNIFTLKLQQLGKGYQGMQYRKASEYVLNFSNTTKYNFLFVGFNALNAAEQHIFQTLIRADKADVIWDADANFFKDHDHDASLFLRQIKKKWTVPHKINEQLHDAYADRKKIQISGVPKNIGQAKYVAQLLKHFSPEKLSGTALILADESLLIPVLNSLPDNVQNVNITMGLSMDQLPMTLFINQLVELKKEAQKEKNYYYKDLISLLQNSVTKLLVGEAVCLQLYYKIIENNYVYVNKQIIEQTIGTNLYFNLLLEKFTTTESLISDLISIFQLLKDKTNTANYSFHLSHIPQYLNIFQELLQIVQKHEYIKSLNTFQQILNNKLSRETIDFKGEPFQGLQIMGVLESRCLDFKTVIITSVNEGTLPAASKGNSFIPFDLKLSVGLPTYKEKDAIYAYHFYRLLQRCENAYLIYNTQVDNLNSGEKSRFIQQMELEPHPNHSVKSVVVSTDSEMNYAPIEEIQKDESVINKLQEIAFKGFSPSALGSYLRDPLSFYEQYILGVRDPNEVEEEVAANTMGSVIHNVLENFYKPLENQILTVQHMEQMQKKISKYVLDEFHKIYSDTQITNGINYITVQAAITYIQKFLRLEKAQIEAGSEIQIISIESKLEAAINIPELNFPVKIYGKVDRVDRLNGQLRIVDYKTGSVKNDDLKIQNWENLIDGNKKTKALQVLIYAYIYTTKNNLKTPPEAGIISLKKMNDGFLSFQHKTDGSKQYDKNITPEVFDNFLEQLRHLIIEICDITIPFVKKEIKIYKK